MSLKWIAQRGLAKDAKTRRKGAPAMDAKEAKEARAEEGAKPGKAAKRS
jgi:hypothetical protein